MMSLLVALVLAVVLFGVAVKVVGMLLRIAVFAGLASLIYFVVLPRIQHIL